MTLASPALISYVTRWMRDSLTVAELTASQLVALKLAEVRHEAKLAGADVAHCVATWTEAFTAAGYGVDA